ncbi:DUF6578 domain-containing protein [Rhodococcus sp. IEGM 1379]|uniref:DUF6578 domain-containing protein n=1 Tax=Rhodococcus sp. IEGM 1379 TaxID=3047086 RepID=UPI0024B6F622|nr:DUF6578 domain-containing protein [Rhodococcus sp. IEGM 1379]MDI9916649.1 hypothetical protein [Rhodococcus sp. IEGM 1379]
MRAHRFTEATPVDSSVEIVTVHVEIGEIECCGPLPVVGEQCSWMLTSRAESYEVDGWVHGGMPAPGVLTTGVVLGILVVTTTYEEVGSLGEWLPVAGSENYRRVGASPRWFRRFGDFDVGPQNRIETGVVVELAVARS